MIWGVTRQGRPRCGLFRPSQTLALGRPSPVSSLPGGSGEEACGLELQPTRPHQPVSEVDSALWEGGHGLGCPGPEWAEKRDGPEGLYVAAWDQHPHSSRALGPEVRLLQEMCCPPTGQAENRSHLASGFSEPKCSTLTGVLGRIKGSLSPNCSWGCFKEY